MPLLERSALLRFRAQDMYRLVGDVESYPAFVPGCVSAQVETAAIDCVRARLGFRVRGLEDSFATENRMADGERIDVELLDGPFRQLRGSWQFLPLAEDACKVSLRLSVDFGNRMLEAALGPWVDRAINGVIDAFRLRAEVLYGRG